MRLRGSIRRLHLLAESCLAAAVGMMGTGNRHGPGYRAGVTETTVTTRSIEVGKLLLRTLTIIGQKRRAGLRAIMVITLSMAAEPGLRTLRTLTTRVARVV